MTKQIKQVKEDLRASAEFIPLPADEQLVKLLAKILLRAQLAPKDSFREEKTCS